MLLAIMDISAHAISLAARPRPGHSGHQCSHAPGRPNLHLVSSSRRPRRVSRIDLPTSSWAPHLSVLISRCNGAFSNLVSIANVPGFSVVGVGDVNGTGYADVVVQDFATGQILYANVNGGIFNNWVGLPAT